MNNIGTKKKAVNSKKTQTIVPLKGTQSPPRRKTMTMAEVEQKAVSRGIQPGQMNKTELIHSIQRSEGYNPCFGTSNGQCPYTDCCFMDDCLPIRS